MIISWSQVGESHAHTKCKNDRTYSRVLITWDQGQDSFWTHRFEWNTPSTIAYAAHRSMNRWPLVLQIGVLWRTMNAVLGSIQCPGSTQWSKMELETVLCYPCRCHAGQSSFTRSDSPLMSSPKTLFFAPLYFWWHVYVLWFGLNKTSWAPQNRIEKT